MLVIQLPLESQCERTASRTEFLVFYFDRSYQCARVRRRTDRRGLSRAQLPRHVLQAYSTVRSPGARWARPWSFRIAREPHRGAEAGLAFRTAARDSQWIIARRRERQRGKVCWRAALGTTSVWQAMHLGID